MCKDSVLYCTRYSHRGLNIFSLTYLSGIHSYLHRYICICTVLTIGCTYVTCVLYSPHITFMYTVYIFQERKHKITVKS